MNHWDLFEWGLCISAARLNSACSACDISNSSNSAYVSWLAQADVFVEYTLEEAEEVLSKSLNSATKYLGEAVSQIRPFSCILSS